MAWEADIIADYSSYSNSIADIIVALSKAGWCLNMEQAEYLPLHDNDMFDWQQGALSDEELFSLINTKQQFGELCGIILYHQNSDAGITMLANNTNEIMFSLSINRKTLSGGHTDISWYIENLIRKLEDLGYITEHIKYTEIIG